MIAADKLIDQVITAQETREELRRRYGAEPRFLNDEVIILCYREMEAFKRWLQEQIILGEN